MSKQLQMNLEHENHAIDKNNLDGVNIDGMQSESVAKKVLSDLFLWANNVENLSLKKTIKLKTFLKQKKLVDFLAKDIYNLKGTLNIGLNKFNLFNEDTEVLNTLKYEMKKKNIKYISFYDEEYPNLLREIFDPPMILYYKGNIELLKKEVPKIAIVGSRKNTEYGSRCTMKFSRELSSLNITVVSGLAMGIDAISHMGAYKNKGKTIAVLGSGIDNPTPSVNKKLAEEILQNNGLIISEHNFNTVVRPYFFSMRNRIISGISSGTLVIEAGQKSGALITAKSANEQGRNVYAVPGSIFSTNTRGCHYLINQGAKLVVSTQEILTDLKYTGFFECCIKNDDNIDDDIDQKNKKNICFLEQNKVFDKKTLAKVEKMLYIIAQREFCEIEQLIEQTNLKIYEINYIMNKLKMYDIIIELKNKKFTLKI